MSSKSNQFETDLLNHVFANTAITLIGDAAGLLPSTAPGSLYISLHTADPGEAGDQTTSEATYTGYSRVAVVRSAAGWTIAGNQVSNAAIITFGQATAGTNVITHFGIGASASGAGKLLYKGSLGNSNQGPFTGAVTGNLITIPGHTLAVNDTVAFYAAAGSTLPGGVTEGATYFVKTVAANDITISLTQGGAAVTISAAGDGVVFKVSSLSVSTNITPSFAIGALVVQED